mmetsp:Transcript_68812/g.157918  ORF Transcript_68812/g.157918 Transcript_68812/m.157918 type:complete len:277 (+) Transcript_68812:351-1181(+)
MLPLLHVEDQVGRGHVLGRPNLPPIPSPQHRDRLHKVLIPGQRRVDAPHWQLVAHRLKTLLGLLVRPAAVHHVQHHHPPPPTALGRDGPVGGEDAIHAIALHALLQLLGAAAAADHDEAPPGDLGQPGLELAFELEAFGGVHGHGVRLSFLDSFSGLSGVAVLHLLILSNCRGNVHLLLVPLPLLPLALPLLLARHQLHPPRRRLRLQLRLAQRPLELGRRVPQQLGQPSALCPLSLQPRRQRVGVPAVLAGLHPVKLVPIRVDLVVPALAAEEDA